MRTILALKLWIFEISFATVISFIVGILMGIIILMLLYALLVVSSMRSKDFITKTENDDLTTQEVKDMVSQAQKSYKDKSIRLDKPRFNHCIDLSKDLAYQIALRYYPNSTNPLLELSVNELTILMEYITERVDEILNRKAIRILRQTKLITIVNISTKAKEIEKSDAFKTTVKVGKVASKIKNIISIINPLNLGRKLIVDKIINMILDKICIVVISIVGEETYKIYSKKVFNKDVDIDTGTEKELEDLSLSIKEAALDIDEEVVKTSDNEKRLKSKIVRFDNTDEYYSSFVSDIPMKRKVDVSDEKEENN